MNQKQYPQQPQEVKHAQQINICKLIGKPKQLIEKSSLNKVYQQHWGNQLEVSPLSCSTILNERMHKKRCSTQMQFRAIGKSINKVKNTKFVRGDVKLCLTEVQEQGILGKLVFERVPNKKNWSWQAKTAQGVSGNLFQNGKEPNFDDDITVQFDSKFESGNLLRAYKCSSPKTYALLTHKDTNTLGYNQWFYFRARSSKSFETIRFQIINMRKNYSSFQKGMKVAAFSEQKWREDKIGWYRAGNNIEYSCNDIRLNDNSDSCLFSIGWDYGFQKQNQWVYFAYAYPYTYSELKLMISKTKKYKSEAQWVNLCQTVLKNQIYLLKIDSQEEITQKINQNGQINDSDIGFQEGTLIEDPNKQKQKVKLNFNRLFKKKRQLSFNQRFKQDKIGTIDQSPAHSKELRKGSKKFLSRSKRKPIQSTLIKQKDDKELLIIMARAHPGQTPSSFIIEGVINGLLKQNIPEAKYLKQKLSIFVIPMLNPDGVIHGNTRTSLTGNDLNRRWLKPNAILHPEIYNIKQYFKQIVQKGKKIFAMVDIHGHSKKQSSFLYGCCDKKNYHNHAEVKLLNVLLGRSEQNFNSSYSSHFVGESKKSTARVNFYREFKCFSYTLEASFLGCFEGSSHFSVADYYGIGKNLLRSLAYFHAATRGRNKSSSLHSINQILLSNSLLKKAVLDHFDRFKMTKNSKQKDDEEQKSSEGSSSAPSQCNFSEQILLQNLFTSNSTKGQTRYRTKSYNKVGKRNMSLSIDDKIKISIVQEQKTKRNKNLQSKTSFKQRKSQNYNKLPLINIQSKEQEEPIYQFHAFNFKSKKMVSKNINKKVGLLLESTID